MFFVPPFRTEKVRWIEAINPKTSGEQDGEKIYEEWGNFTLPLLTLSFCWLQILVELFSIFPSVLSQPF